MTARWRQKGRECKDRRWIILGEKELKEWEKKESGECKKAE